jgi:DNA-nicking Smr family endonuclease
MARRREPTDSELALWTEVTKDVRRAQRKKRIAKPLSGEPHKKTKEAQVQLQPATPVPRKPVHLPTKPVRTHQQLDGSTLRRLREGKVDPDAKLDLHGLTQAQAHSRLATFLHRAHDHDLRCVLVVTGKGGGRPEIDRSPFEAATSGHGVLKSMVPRWLTEGDIRRFVSGTADAHARHGGAGALYVYLRRRKPLG